MNTPAAQSKPRTPRHRHWARRTHRVVAVSSLVFLVLITLSGLLLNHTEALGLSRHAASPLLLRVYGIEVPPVDSAFAAGEVIFATSSGIIYADGEELAANVTEMSGAIEYDGGLVAATRDELFLTMKDGRLIERFAPEASTRITRLGTDGQRIVVAMPDELFEFDAVQMKFSPTVEFGSSSITWSQALTLDAAQAKKISSAGLGRAISWERVLLDLHSGRILPTVGRYIADLAALCLLYLCISGLILWTRRR